MAQKILSHSVSNFIIHKIIILLSKLLSVDLVSIQVKKRRRKIFQFIPKEKKKTAFKNNKIINKTSINNFL